ncbi:sigma 54-interacting transcriptional regulator, partial [Bacteroidota bacterium]
MDHINKNEFFQKATLHICGQLEIEKALLTFIRYIKQSIPADRIFLLKYDAGGNSMRAIAEATYTKSKKSDLLIRLSGEAKSDLKKIEKSKIADVVFYNGLEKGIIGREILDSYKVKANAMLIMLLRTEYKLLGSFVLIADGRQKYHENHAKLISLLKETFVLALSNTLEHRKLIKRYNLLIDDNQYLHTQLRRKSGDEIIGANFGLRNVMEMVRQVSSVISPVLLVGEIGVGKDIIANAIHYYSSKNKGPFVSLNCSDIPDHHIDGELFGYEKGAFPGA